MNQNHFYFGRMISQPRERPFNLQSLAPVTPPRDASAFCVGITARFPSQGSLSTSFLLPGGELLGAVVAALDATLPTPWPLPVREESMGILEGQLAPEPEGHVEFGQTLIHTFYR